MKTQIITLTTTLVLSGLVGCGKPKADNIGVQSQIHADRTSNQFQVKKEVIKDAGIFIQALPGVTDGSKVSSEVRKGTMIIFPAGEELKDFEYEFPEAEWVPVISEGRLPYGKQLPRVLKKEDTSANKIKNLANILLSIGKLKDISFRLYAGVDMKGDVLKGQKNQVIASVGCYEIKEGENAGKCKIAPDETTEEKVTRTKRTCKKLSKHMDRFIELNEQQTALFAGTLQKCNMIEGGQAQVKAKIKKIKAITDAGESLAVGATTAYGDHIGRVHLPLIASESRNAPDGFDESVIKFNKDMTKVEELKLAINFGGGNEYPNYSIENGKILNVNLSETAKGSKYLEFTINGPVIVTAKLSITSEEISIVKDGPSPRFVNVRLKGETQNIFPNGDVRKGVMAIELSSK